MPELFKFVALSPAEELCLFLSRDIEADSSKALRFSMFTLQGQIAQEVADKLQVEVSPDQKTALQEASTVDLVAYDAYLRAKELMYDIALSLRQKDDLFQVVELLDQAVTRDPSFFEAYCQLAGAHDRIFFLAFDHTNERLKLSEAVIQSIQRLHPERGETHLALAQHYYYVYRDYDRARQELVLAQLTLRNESRIPLLAAYIDRRQGRWEKSLEEMGQALELNPRDFSVLQQIALTDEALGRYKDAAATLDRMEYVLWFYVKPIDVIQPPVPRFGYDRQTPPVTSGVRCTVFDSPGNDSVTRHTDAMCVRNHDWPFQKPAFIEPGGPRHFAIPVQTEIASIHGVVERIVSTRNDRSNTSAHRALANFQFSLATDQGRVAYLYARDIRDRVQLPWCAVERHTEIARANDLNLCELLYRRQ